MPRLRRDKVVRRLVADLQSSLRDAIPAGTVVLFTVTAPIRLPARTAQAIDELARACVARHRRSGATRTAARRVLHGNGVCIRLVRCHAPGPCALGFVHNPDLDARAILDMAEHDLERKSR